MPCRIATSHFKRCGRNISGKDLGVRQFMRQSHSQTPRASAHVGDSQRRIWFAGTHVDFDSAGPEALQSHFDYVLRFWPGNQHVRIDFEFESPKFLLAGEILRWLAARSSGDHRKVFSRHGSIEPVFRMRIEPGSVAVEGMHQKQFGSKRRGRDPRRAQLRHTFFQRLAQTRRDGLRPTMWVNWHYLAAPPKSSIWAFS